MYTFRDAVNDTKAFYDCEYFHNLLTKITGKTMTESDLEVGVLSAYKIMFRVLFKDKLNHLYKKPKDQTDKLLVVEKFGKVLIPLMAIYYLTKDYTSETVRPLREQIKEWIDIYKTYLTVDNVYIDEFNIAEIQEYINGQDDED